MQFIVSFCHELSSALEAWREALQAATLAELRAIEETKHLRDWIMACRILGAHSG